jgi:hypothetical protein
MSEFRISVGLAGPLSRPHYGSCTFPTSPRPHRWALYLGRRFRYLIALNGRDHIGAEVTAHYANGQGGSGLFRCPTFDANRADLG